jgi:hypothetical protein
MIGYKLLGRPLRVDHVLDYRLPRRYDPNEKDEEGKAKVIEYKVRMEMFCLLLLAYWC